MESNRVQFISEYNISKKHEDTHYKKIELGYNGYIYLER